MNFKDIHIGTLIQQAVLESNISEERIGSYLKLTASEILEVYENKSMDTDELLKWSKLLDYDFFRVFSQHLILYSPPTNLEKSKDSPMKSALPTFRKNIYTRELIDFILERIQLGEMSIKEVISQYGVPKTTLYKWINKYGTV